MINAALSIRNHTVWHSGKGIHLKKYKIIFCLLSSHASFILRLDEISMLFLKKVTLLTTCSSMLEKGSEILFWSLRKFMHLWKELSSTLLRLQEMTRSLACCYTNGMWHENLWTWHEEWHDMTDNSVITGQEVGIVPSRWWHPHGWLQEPSLTHNWRGSLRTHY